MAAPTNVLGLLKDRIGHSLRRRAKAREAHIQGASPVACGGNTSCGPCGPSRVSRRPDYVGTRPRPTTLGLRSPNGYYRQANRIQPMRVM